MKPKFSQSLIRRSPATGKCSAGRRMPGPTRIASGSAAVIGLLSLAAPQLSAQTYTIVPTGSPLDWNTPASWDLNANFPGSVGGDIAKVSGDFGAAAKVVDISATPPEGLSRLFIGNTNPTPETTTIQSANASILRLSAATITSVGAVGAVNVISAPVSLTGNLTFGPENDTSTTPPTVVTPNVNGISITGKITPSASGNRIITNLTGMPVMLGDIDITSEDTASLLTVINDNVAGNRINLRGVIANGISTANGVSPASALILDGKVNDTIFEIGSGPAHQNLHTGVTTLQSNGATGTLAKFIINSSQPFGAPPGTGVTLNIGQRSGSTTVIESLVPNLVLPHNTLCARNNNFVGANGVAFNGAVSFGSSYALTNNLETTGQLVFNGRVNLENVNNQDSRVRSFNGTGTTVINGTLADSPTPDPDKFGGVNLTSTGKLVINGTVTSQGMLRISGGGTIQLGTGGTTGTFTPDFATTSHADYTPGGTPPFADPKTFPNILKKTVVTGGNASVNGTFAVNRSDEFVLPAAMNGLVGLKQIGLGTLVVDSQLFNTGANQIGDGVTASNLRVTAAAMAESTQTGDFGSPAVAGAGYVNWIQTITNLEDTSTLRVGQPVYVNTASAVCYIYSIDNATQITVMGSGVSSASTGVDPGSGSVTDRALKFGEGSGLGASTATTTINNLGTLSGTGTVSGSVHALSGGGIAPGVNTTGNSGAAGTLTTGALTLDPGAKLNFDVDATAAGANDHVATANQAVTLGALNITYSGLAGGTLQTGVPYTLINAGTGTITADTAAITSTFLGALNGYTAAYANTGSTLTVTFSGASTGGGDAYSDWSLLNAPGQTADQDYDHDGMSNGVEYFMGQSGSGFTKNPTPDSTGKVIWPKSPTFAGTYTVQTSATLLSGSWTDVPSTLNGNQVEYTIPTGQGKIFTRLKVTPN